MASDYDAGDGEYGNRNSCDDNEDEDDIDYYAILNISKEAATEDIKLAYRGMCIKFHPDKHQDKHEKELAAKLFSKIQKAHEVLSDPQKRAIYDVYGCKGLDADWEIVERKQTPEEIREEYERLQKERDEKRLLQRTNPEGAISVTVNATEFFDSYDDGYSEETASLPSVDIKGMTIHQSIEAPLTRKDTAVLSGMLHTENGNGSGSVNVSLRRILSHKMWGQIEFGAGQGATFQVKGFRNLTRKMFATLSVNTEMHQSYMSAGLQAVAGHQLGKNTTGYLSWRYGIMPSLSSTVVHNSEGCHISGSLQLSPGATFGAIIFHQKVSENTKLKLSLRCSVIDAAFSYGCEHKVSMYSRLSASVAVGTLNGVSLKIRLHRYTQSYRFPIILSDVISPSAIFYGTVTPLIIYTILKQLVINPYIEQEKEEDLARQRERNAERLIERRREAEATVQLLQDVYTRCIERESSKHGLVIVNAWYGKLVSSTANAASISPQVIDVTIAVQCLVQDSKLILTESCKHQLNGFYDPCVGESKSLQIIYQFRDELHEAVIADNELCRIPKQSHRITSSR